MSRYYIGTLDDNQEVLYYGAEEEGVSTTVWHKHKEKEKARSWDDHKIPSALIQNWNTKFQRFQFFLVEA